jgi:hypothetical protein
MFSNAAVEEQQDQQQKEYRMEIDARANTFQKFKEIKQVLISKNLISKVNISKTNSMIFKKQETILKMLINFVKKSLTNV